MSNKKTVFFVIIGLFVTIFILYFISLSNVNKKKTKIIEKKSIDSSYNFKFNQVDKYDIEFKQNSDITLNNLIEQNLTLKAFLYVKVKKIDKDNIWLLMQLSNIDIASTNLEPILIKKLKEVYSKLFLVSILPNGDILKVIYPANKDNYGGIEEFLSYLSIINIPYKYYEKKQTDKLGTYKSIYEKNDFNINKSIEKYFTVFSDIYSNIKVVKSNFDIKIDKNGNWINSIYGQNHIKIYDGKKIVIDSNNILSFVKNNTSLDSNLKIFNENDAIETIKKQLLREENNDKNIYSEIKKTAYKKVIKERKIKLKNIMDNILSKPKNIYSYVNLRDYIRAYPQKIDELIDNFDIFQDYEQRKIISFLAIIDDPLIQKGLVRLINNDDTSRLNKVRSTIALGLSKHPTQESKEVLLDKIEQRDTKEDKELSDTSLLALGSFAKKNNDKDISDKLTSLYNDAKSNSLKLVLLRAMQNAGARHYLPELKDGLKSKSYKVRLLSANIIKKIKDIKLQKKIFQSHLKEETNSRVRKVINKQLELIENNQI